MMPVNGTADAEDRRWVLAVDFGTTNTVAAVAEVGSQPHVMHLPGGSSMPSAVFRAPATSQSEERWIVGPSAIGSAHNDMSRFEPAPKRQVRTGSVFLAGRTYPVSEPIAAILKRVFDEGAKQHSHSAPSAVVLTHPALWAGARLEVLLEAARMAIRGLPSWPQPVLLLEPVAAARHIAGRARNLPWEFRVAVVDLGGGTCDVAVIDRSGDQYQVAGPALGEDPLGGDDFDVAVADYALAEIGNAALTDRLTNPQTPGDRICAHDLLTSARAAKERLSDEPTASITVPYVPGVLDEHQSVQINQEQLNELIRGTPERPGLARAAELLAQALAEASQPSPRFGGVFLVGGSSRIPLLGQLVTQVTNHPPGSHGDPVTAVAEGAASYGLDLLREKEPPEPGPTPPPNSGTIPVAPKPWYRKPAALVLSLALVGALVALGIGLFQSEPPETNPSPPTTSMAEPGGGGRTMPPTEPEPTVTCDSGDVVSDQSECPDITCWDDTTAATVAECPPLQGVAGLQYVFSGEPSFDSCEEYVGDNIGEGELEVFSCQWDDLTGVGPVLSRWDSTDSAKTYFTENFGKGIDFEVGGDDVAIGTKWASYAGKNPHCAYLYDEFPFSVLVYGDANENELVKDACDRLRFTKPAILREKVPT